MGSGLGARVAEPLSGDQRDLLDSGPIMPVAAPVEEISDGAGQLPGMGIGPNAGGMLDGDQQHGVLGGEPLHGPSVAAAAVEMSGPGCRPSNLNIRAASSRKAL